MTRTDRRALIIVVAIFASMVAGYFMSKDDGGDPGPVEPRAVQVGDMPTFYRYEDWTLSPKSDPMSDEDRSTLHSDATGLTRGTLWIRCTGPSVEVLIDFDDRPSSAWTEAMWRLDQDAPSDWVSLSPSTDKSAAFLGSTEAELFLQSLVNHDSLAVRGRDDRGQTHDFDISLYGAPEALAALGCTAPLLGE